ncbi:MAG TPA: tetratricopeptide repeat protein, partial [Candidatus Kapabacteria bacterium]|nr:tetratricopeptide repeat protein [Candidatus Kapabacteria bacterium]
MRTSRRLHSNGTLLFAVEARRQLAAGEPRRAIETCKMGLARHPDHAAGYVVLAAAYRSAGEPDRARLVLMRGYERTGLDSLRALSEAAASESTDVPVADGAGRRLAVEHADAPQVAIASRDDEGVDRLEEARREAERIEAERLEAER